MYRQIDTRIWSDPKVKALGRDAKLAWVYLLTNNLTHLSGIYHLPSAWAAMEIGFEVEQYLEQLDTLRESGLVDYDPETEEVWVVNFLAYQACNRSNIAAASKQVKGLHSERLACAFLNHYEHLLGTLPAPGKHPLNTRSTGCPAGVERVSAPGRPKDQDQDQDQETPECVCDDSDSSTQGGHEVPTGESTHTQDSKNPKGTPPGGGEESESAKDPPASSRGSTAPSGCAEARPRPAAHAPPGGAVAHASARHRGTRPPAAMVPPDPCKPKDSHEETILLELACHHARLLDRDPPPKLTMDDHMRRILEAVRTFGLSACERLQVAHAERCRKDPQHRWRAWSDAYPFQRKHGRSRYDALDYDRARALVDEGRAIQQRQADPLAGHTGR